MTYRPFFMVAGAAALIAALAAGCGSDSGGDAKKKTDAGTDGADGGDAGTGGGPNPTYDNCSSDKWCWELPKPQGNTLRGTWASSEDDIWAVGDHGTVIHWDGKGWAGLDPGTQEDLNAVWGASASDVWAVGNGGTIAHWDGKAFSLMALEPDPDAGLDGGVTTDFYGVSGSKGSDIWAVGEAGAIWHYDGNKWAGVESPATQTLYAVWAAPTGEAWAGGAGGGGGPPPRHAEIRRHGLDARYEDHRLYPRNPGRGRHHGSVCERGRRRLAMVGWRVAFVPDPRSKARPLCRPPERNHSLGFWRCW